MTSVAIDSLLWNLEKQRRAKSPVLVARDLRLYRNGALVGVWRGPLTLDRNGKVNFETDVPIVAGNNRLTAYVLNNAYIKSADATLSVAGSALRLILETDRSNMPSAVESNHATANPISSWR